MEALEIDCHSFEDTGQRFVLVGGRGGGGGGAVVVGLVGVVETEYEASKGDVVAVGCEHKHLEGIAQAKASRRLAGMPAADSEAACQLLDSW